MTKFNFFTRLVPLLRHGHLIIGVFCFCACGSPDKQGEVKQRTNEPLIPDGMAIFRKNCVTCHGTDGKLGLNGAKDLTSSPLTLEERINIVTNGKKLMTPFGKILSPEEIRVVAEYTLTLPKK